MTNSNYTALAFVIDNSGSMDSIREETTQALDEFMKEQLDQDGELSATVTTFSSKVKEVALLQKENLESLDLRVIPSGMTALYDAIGITINRLGEALHDLPEDERPGKVLFLIATDGFENSSQEFKAQDVKNLIDEQKNKYSWDFIFLGANQDAVTTAKDIGIHADSALTFSATREGVTRAVAAAAQYTRSYRAGEDAAFSQSDREESNR